ncbi:MAG TPA: hypothetical protein VNX15_11515 [Gemmatimonadales bacterium]|jgi:hypothetical protein|nr:hypothetical protein [Gemmatimonadales bacterium]
MTMFDARDAGLDQALNRSVFMGIGRPVPARQPRPSLRLTLLLILLGLVMLLGLAGLAGAADGLGKQVQKATGGQGAGQVTPSEKFPGNFPAAPVVVPVGEPGNFPAAHRAPLYNFLQFVSARPEPRALQLFPVTNNLEAPLLPKNPDDAPWLLMIVLAVLLWVALIGSVRSRRPW